MRFTYFVTYLLTGYSLYSASDGDALRVYAYTQTKVAVLTVGVVKKTMTRRAGCNY